MGIDQGSFKNLFRVVAAVAVHQPELRQQFGPPPGAAVGAVDLQRLGQVLECRGQASLSVRDKPEAAEQSLCEALRISREHSVLYTMAMAQHGLAEVCYRRSRLIEARRHADWALRISQQQRYQTLEAHVRNLLGRMEWRDGDRETAVEQFERGLDIAETIGHPGAMSQALVGIAYIDLNAGRRHAARQHALRAVQVADDAGYRLQRSNASEALAHITLVMDESAQRGDRSGDGVPAGGGR